MRQGVQHEMLAKLDENCHLQARLPVDRIPTREGHQSIGVPFDALHAPAEKLVYVELPDEEGVDKQKYCGRLNYSLYGTRDAAMNW